MRARVYHILLLIAAMWVMVGCRDTHVSDDPSLRLRWEKDTLNFDTLLTAQGSATMRVILYNPNPEAIVIDQVWLKGGSKSYFSVNIDGESDLNRIDHIQINGGDSLFVFVQANIDRQRQDNPVLIEDALHLHLRSQSDYEHLQTLTLQAYGQDVIRIHSKDKRTDYQEYTFTATRPYHVFDTLVIGDATIEPGATLYMHAGASIYVVGDIHAQGTSTAPITIRGDRLDRLFDSVPYHYASGNWDGIYLMHDAESATHEAIWEMNYVDILSGTIGLYCYSNVSSGTLPQLLINGCRIHNHSLYGVVLIGVDACVANTEVSNCGSYCAYLKGGRSDWTHTTIASYYGSTNIHLHPTGKEDVAAVYIDNLSKNSPQTTTNFRNCIITGARTQQLVVATPFDRYYPGEWTGNYLKCDTLRIPHAHDNVYWTAEADTVNLFRNTYYQSKEYTYYDFRLDSISPAIGIGDSIVALSYPQDRLGNSRQGIRPDAGCYQH